MPRNAENYISIIVRIHAGTVPFADLRSLYFLSFETSDGIEYYRRFFQIEKSLAGRFEKDFELEKDIFYTKIDTWNYRALKFKTRVSEK